MIFVYKIIVFSLKKPFTNSDSWLPFKILRY